MARRSRSRKKNLADLRDAREAGRVVRVVRTFGSSSDLDGLVLAISRKWVLLAPVDTGETDGFAAVRLATVQAVEESPSRRFHETMITQTGGPPRKRTYRAIDLRRTRDLIRTAAAEHALITLHLEGDWPGEAYIGQPVGFTKKAVRLLEVDLDAEWWDAPTRWRIRDITRIDFDGVYERNLDRVGPPMPKRWVRRQLAATAAS